MLLSLEAHSTFTNGSKVAVVYREVVEGWQHVLTPTLTFLFFFFGGEHGGESVEGEGKSCRPPLSSPHVPVLAPELLTFHDAVFKKKKEWDKFKTYWTIQKWLPHYTCYSFGREIQ